MNVKRVIDGTGLSGKLGAVVLGMSLLAQPLSAQTTPNAGPVDLTKQVPPAPVTTAPEAPLQAPVTPVPLPPAPLPTPHWSQTDAQSLLATIKGIGAEGLFAKDYQPELLSAAIVKGEGPELDEIATRLFTTIRIDEMITEAL